MSGAIAKRAGNSRPNSTRKPTKSKPTSSAGASGGKAWFWFLGLAGIFLAIECLVPLGSAIKLGVDEDYELSRTILFVKGFHFYTGVWMDQPLLYTFMLAQNVAHAPNRTVSRRKSKTKQIMQRKRTKLRPEPIFESK